MNGREAAIQAHHADATGTSEQGLGERDKAENKEVDL